MHNIIVYMMYRYTNFITSISMLYIRTLFVRTGLYKFLNIQVMLIRRGVYQTQHTVVRNNT